MRFAAGLVLALVLAAPSAAAPSRLDVPAPVTVPPVDADARIASVGFARMSTAGEPLGWRSRAGQAADPELADIFRAEFAKANLKVDDAPAKTADKAADLQVGARVTDFRASLAAKGGGAAVLDVEWQVYSANAAKVVARIRTRGGVRGAKGGRIGETVAALLQQAFAENVRQLAAQPRFRQIVLAPRATAASRPLAALEVAYRTGARAVPLKDAVGGVVVIFARGEMGSGVLIAPEGYILTNRHVVGAARRVRIRWADGGETDGEVVRADARRDVALVKVASAPKGRPLAIRRTPVDLGESVYAIGTPMSDAYQNTVTRGIVSATRSLDGRPFIQSDAGMTHGNSGGPLVDENGAVVGLADLTVDAAQGSTINFFIPIAEALKALALRPAG